MKLDYGAASFATTARWLAISAMCATVAACGTTQAVPKKKSHGKEYFSESEYGVKASPRVATGNNIPKGGGRYIVGNAYEVKGKWYYPKEDFAYNKVGVASWYGSAFHGRLTANGEVYDQMHLSAAHPTFPLPSYARVTNLESGSSVIVRVNDRGPYHEGRIIDLSNKTADMLDLQHSGTGKVRVQYVGRARMDGHDMPYLMASYAPKGSRIPGVNPEGQIATGVMVASNSRKITRDQLQSSEDYETPANVPVPRSATSYAGSTPSAHNNAAGAAATAQAPAAHVLVAPTAPSFNNGAQAMDQMVVLPEIGPMPYERPQNSLALGYQNEEVKTVTVDLAFDAVMVRNDGLTQESILASAKRQQAKFAAR
ncbi:MULTISPECIES: septal ring lytic transglycosylase RlpA family protein [Rhizobium]|uniref:septal ring lytic transglycosylase RlpA family protein n=1 Tax=Rhizobium TaxID=379 RepID=UPI00104056C3|nr:MULTISPECIES: septal ring lytic transglycosylase RlpA family protein [Rhizobium]KAF5883134.1 septal ring lytic transglycosylase RlpA family protein [Rhizobium sp. PEPV16]MBY5801540.1 septal ring lytic transglycosylase RlpA family protein [Rhizobium leguminosarum]NKL96747.1 septal ring lytic transglycosylase RlpA family protein [Rhizobium leguminosarum bv. viciae]TCA11006.1 septal ring lytic transglycosylase RlpA family protein [Rhizobium leguminosarum bv. viciae]UFW80430.1 septal ring lytic